MYIGATIGTFIFFLNASPTIYLILTYLFDLLNYIGFEFNASIALLIIPTSILLIINLKKINLDTRYAISQILSFISVVLLLLSIVIPYLIYLTWLEDQPGMNREVWGTVIPILMSYTIGLLINFIVFILLTIKRD